MRPLALLLLAALAAPAAALDDLDAHYDSSQAIGVCLGAYPDLRQWVHAYDEETREEFYALYRAFADKVQQRRNEGWSNGQTGGLGRDGNWGNLGTNLGGRHALQWDNSRTALEKRRDKAKEALAAAPPERKPEIQAELNELESALNARFGTCNDWARETSDLLRGMRPRKFDINDRVKDGIMGTGIGNHAYTLVCPKGLSQDRCIGFDPWKHGLPELYKGNDLASNGPSGAFGCFHDASAREQMGAH